MASLIAAGIVVILIDQASKEAIARLLVNFQFPSRRAIIQIGSIARKQSKRKSVPLLLILLLLFIIIFLSVVILIYYHLAYLTPWAQIAMGSALGGAGSNLLDRIFRDTVIDFIHLGPWPVFNFADMAICFGVITALLMLH